MTRAQYEAKYGITPVVNTFDTTPAPERMTRAEYQAKYGVQPGTPNPSYQIRQNYLAGKLTPPDVIAQSIGIAARNVNEELNAPLLSISPGGTRFIPNPIGITMLGLGKVSELFGSAVSAVADPTFSAIGKALRDAVGPEKADEIKESLKIALSSPTVQSLVKTGSSPQVSGGLTALKDVTELGLTLVGTGETARGLSGAFKVLDPKSPVGGFIEQRRAANIENIIAQREKQLFDIETNYAKTRKAIDYSKDEGVASRNRVASTDVLVDAVDSEGVIRTKQKGGAVDQYRAQTIDGGEGVVRQNLAREGAVVNLVEVAKYLKKEINKSGLEGGDLETAINGLKKEILGLRRRANEFGDIELVKVHDAKINTTKNINYQTPPETATYRKAVARAYKTLVEDKSSFNVREVNAELTKYYKDIELLENLDGKRVKGGKLGKYFARVGGNIAGAAAGGIFGGLPGTAIGTVVGGEVAAMLKGKSMAGTFGREIGKEAPKSTVLEKAKETGGLPKERDLTKPDPRVGVAKTIPKTKEVYRLEKEIADNVEAQKRAIRSGDTTLVQKLKEVYDYLVEQLKVVIRKIKTERGGFIDPNAIVGKDLIPEKSGKLQRKPLSNDSTSAKGSQPPVFMGFSDLTTKVLERLKGKSITSKQEILDFTNMPELKQAERDLIRNVANDFGKDVPVQEFANKVKTELLPLKARMSSTKSKDMYSKYEMPPRYENISLSDELRGPIADYQERIYQSPIQTSAGQVHFSGEKAPNYFAHTRIEDLPNSEAQINPAKGGSFNNLGNWDNQYSKEPTRRVIELQSDLFQKGRLEGEKYDWKYLADMEKTKAEGGSYSHSDYKALKALEQKFKENPQLNPDKLEPYRNTWHERVIREEVKQAAKDGKTKLQFPTGDTAMRIEGLGVREKSFVIKNKLDAVGGEKLTPENIKPSQIIYSENDGHLFVTENLGEGKFKAIPYRALELENIEPVYKLATKKGYINKETGGFDFEAAFKDKDILNEVKKSGNDYLNESYDISGKVDTNNPIYRFYEKEVGKYLSNKFGAKRIKDPQGVEWWEVDVPKAKARLPVEAFGIVPFIFSENE